MKTPDSRFYCPLISVGTITLDENESSHAVRVCRAGVGDILQLSDGLGHYADAVITKADAKACEVQVDSIIEATNPRPKVSLGIACLKDDALEEVVFHAAQTEIDSIVFLRTDYSQEPKNSDLHKTVRRAELKSLVSLKQSKKPWLTRIEGPAKTPPPSKPWLPLPRFLWAPRAVFHLKKLKQSRILRGARSTP